MDPASLVVTALGAGASAALTDTASQAVKDAYAALKSLLKTRLAGRPAAAEMIDQAHAVPESSDDPLRKALETADVAADQELIRAAEHLLTLTDPHGTRSGKYNVHISGSKGIVIGDHAQITMTFSDEP